MEEDYIVNTRDNYQGRHGRFTQWSEDRSNSQPAAKCRQLLLHYIQQSIVKTGMLCGDTTVRILDAGCGPGRDVAAFNGENITIPDQPATTLDVECMGFDCCQGFVDTCKSKGLNVVMADFISFFNNNNKKYHGVFSLASLFHLPSCELVKVLGLFHQHLHPNGVLLTTIPEGVRDSEGGDGRWVLHLPVEQHKKLVENAGFTILHTQHVNIYNGCWFLIVAQKCAKEAS